MKEKYHILIVILLTSILLLLSCKEDEHFKNQEKKKETSIKTNDTTGAETFLEQKIITYNLEDAKQYIVDTKNSEVKWFCSKHKGSVKFKSGKLFLVENKIVDGYFSVSMDSIRDIDIDYDLMRGTLENVLKSADFFNVKVFPTTTFKILKPIFKKENEYSLLGVLKILNTSKPISFNCKLHINKDTLFAASESFSIDRTKWGITNSSKKYAESDAAFIVSDKISFIVNIKASLQKDKLKYKRQIE